MNPLLLLARQAARVEHDRAVANARLAATELARARVAREEVELFLASRRPGPARDRSA